MRDYTKSGMTIPHKVIGAIAKGFFRRCPEKGKQLTRFFSEQQLFVKGPDGKLSLERPLSGSPLGLFVEGYTILQYAIHKMNLEDLGWDPDYCSFSATNDDMVVGTDSREDADAYVAVDMINNSCLAMAYKDSKSGISKNKFVFCEEYWTGFDIDPKESLFVGNLIGARYGCTVFHVKEYCYAIMLSSGRITPNLELALRDTQSAVGYEFHEEEYGWPFLFGGWLPCVKDGLDHSIEWFDGDLKACAGYWASRAKLPKQGNLDSRPHLTCGRNAGITLVCEPEELDDWVDLIPYLGSKRLLKRHYARGQTSPKRVTDEYVRLSRIRQSLYDKYLTGEKELPPVMHKWLERHPNSVWLKHMPGMVTVDAFSMITNPRLGIPDSSETMRLEMLRAKGLITLNGDSKDRNPEHITLAEAGILSELTLPMIPASRDEGISTAFLALCPPGFTKWFEDNLKCPISLWEGDAPYKPTRLWGWIPYASLRTCQRYDTWIKSQGLDYTDDVVIWISQRHRQLTNEEWDRLHADEEDPPPCPEVEDPHAAETLLAQIRDVLRDWDPDVDRTMEELKHRVLPARSSHVDPTILAHARAMEELDPYELLGQQVREDIDDSVGSDVEDETFDPWAELGYD
jgi:hypothetical protein